jgi:hypothetical protein
MSRHKRAIILTGIVTTCAVGALLAALISGGSAATALDLSATKNYLAARRALETNVERSRAEPGSAVKTYAAMIADTCAGVLKGAPQIIRMQRYVRKGSTLVLAPRTVLLSDAAGGIEQTLRLKDASAIRNFTREVRGLHWSNAHLIKLVDALADEEEAQLEQEAPELCRDARTWAASGYRSLAVKTSRTGERLAAQKEILTRELSKDDCVNPYPGRAVLHVLERTMSSDQRKTAQALSRLEAHVAATNAAIVRSAVDELEKVLGSRLRADRGKFVWLVWCRRALQFPGPFNEARHDAMVEIPFRSATEGAGRYTSQELLGRLQPQPDRLGPGTERLDCES